MAGAIRSQARACAAESKPPEKRDPHPKFGKDPRMFDGSSRSGC